MKNKIIVIILISLIVIFASSCEKAIVKPNQPTITPTESPTPTESIPTQVISYTQKPYFDINAIKFQNEYSEDMEEILSITKKYLSKDNFIYPNSYHAVYNKMFVDYAGGEYSSYSEYLKFLDNSETHTSAWKKITPEEYERTKTFENNLRDPSSLKRVDINNDGENEIVLTWDDTGSMYHLFSTIFIISEDKKLKPWYVFGYNSFMRIICHKGKYYFARPVYDDVSAFDIGIDIIYIQGSVAEAVRVTNDGIRVLSAKEANYYD